MTEQGIILNRLLDKYESSITSACNAAGGEKGVS